MLSPSARTEGQSRGDSAWAIVLVAMLTLSLVMILGLATLGLSDAA